MTKSEIGAPEGDESASPPRVASAPRLGSFFRRPTVWLVFCLVVIAGVIAAMRARGPVVATSKVLRTDLEQHIVASGRVWVVTRFQLSPQTSGRVMSVRVVEGQRVRAGDLLVQINDEEANAAVSEARAMVSQSTARVLQGREVGATVATEASTQAETNLADAQKNLARIEKLVASGDIARADLDEAQRNYQVALSRKKAADAQQVAAMPTGADSRLVEGALIESQSRLSAALVRLQQTRLLAPQTGIILKRTVEPGAIVQPGTTLIEMAASGETQLVIEPDERNLGWIRVGQMAHATADAYPKETFEAEVSYIAPAIDPQRGSVQVRLRVPKPPGFLKPDMTVSVDLTVASKAKVLTVPSDAVHGMATPNPWVFVINQGSLERRLVQLGIRGEGQTEIESGIDEGAEVVRSTDQALLPGQRVRAQPEGR
ncbi:MAG: efflux RND transporter periplasmic adaptor subunit [Bryobacteraceae bacterium]